MPFWNIPRSKVKAITFVGSTATARYIYEQSARNGKRDPAQGCAKNPAVILPDADMEMAVKIIADSAFGCAGQRCLATSLAIAVGETHDEFVKKMCGAAANRKVGYDLDDGVQMGPVISQSSRERIEQLIGKGIAEGANIPVDSRNTQLPGYEKGAFIQPTILQDVAAGSEIARTELFGPVLGIMHTEDLDQAIALINQGVDGNQASLFTSSGSAARKFRYEVEASNIDINIGVAAQMAFFPFSGWKDSFFGDLHSQGSDAVNFFTQKKVVVERWPKAWTRQF